MTQTPYLPPVPSDYDMAVVTDKHYNAASEDETRELLADIEAERDETDAKHERANR